MEICFFTVLQAFYKDYIGVKGNELKMMFKPTPCVGLETLSRPRARDPHDAASNPSHSDKPGVLEFSDP